MTGETDVEAIVAKLTKAQRTALSDASPMILEDGYVSRYRNWRAFPGLIAKDLIEAGSSQRLTPLGLAVRSALLEDTDHAR